MDSSIIFYVIGFVIVGVLVWIRTGQKPVENVNDAFVQWQTALEQAPQVVAAVEQLWQTGAIPKDERLAEAIKRLGEWFPALTETQLRTAIESGVFVLKTGLDLTGVDKNEVVKGVLDSTSALYR